MTRVFVIRPFNLKKDKDGNEINFEEIHNKLIQPAIDFCKLQGHTTGEIIESGNIREDMFQLILEADLVICDITIHNANVFYELGIRHSLRKKRTILIKGRGAGDSTIFDIQTDRYFSYEVANPAGALQDLVKTIEETLDSDRDTDSPIFKLLPSLSEVDPASVQLLHNDFREEVDRAYAAKSKGWLRLLSEEVKGKRFQWQGLKYVGKAQLKLEDYQAAKDSYEVVRKIYPNDAEANSDLANIYERLYRQTRQIKLLTKSGQAIDRVLNNVSATSQERIEALTLRARNKKTRWRIKFEHIEDPTQRCKNAMNRLLLKTFQAYLDAFREDLNHFWSGIAALQMGEIFLHLTKENDFWMASFDDDDDAETYKKQMIKNVESLKFAVKASISKALRTLDASDEDRDWAEISKADLCFLTDSNPYRILQQYQDAVPLDHPFNWNAAKGQLELFVKLNLKAEIAQKVIDAVEQGSISQSNSEDLPKPKHLILFTGHIIDRPDRPEPRFPRDREEQAKELIKAELRQVIQDGYEYECLASAAPGGDILFHEVCQELAKELNINIPSKICLPMPSDLYVAEVYQESYFNDWRSRYLAMKEKHATLVLSDQNGLPKWLKNSSKNQWERGNQWVLKMLQADDAKRQTLIVLWDEKGQGEETGGTAHIIQLAQNTGNIEIRIIKAKELLANIEH